MASQMGPEVGPNSAGGAGDPVPEASVDQNMESSGPGEQRGEARAAYEDAGGDRVLRRMADYVVERSDGHDEGDVARRRAAVVSGP